VEYVAGREGGTCRQEGGTCRQEGGTCRQEGGTCRQESNARKRWTGQVVWSEDNQEQDWGKEEEEGKKEEGEKEEGEKVGFIIKVKPPVHARRAQLDDLENTSDGQSLELLKLSQPLPHLGLLLGNLLRACTWLVTSRAGSEQPSAMPGRSGNRGSTATLARQTCGHPGAWRNLSSSAYRTRGSYGMSSGTWSTAGGSVAVTVCRTVSGVTPCATISARRVRLDRSEALHHVFGADLVVVCRAGFDSARTMSGALGFVLRRHHDVPRPLREPAEPLAGIKI